MTKSNDEIQGFILAGGAGKRMGQPKHALKIAGKTFVEIAANALRAVTAKQLAIVGEIDEEHLKLRSSGEEDQKLRNIQDIVFELDLITKKTASGALIGVYTALSHAKSEWIAVLACDLPFVTGALMTRLSGYCANEFDAVVPLQRDGQSQPLCAFYRREKARSLAHKLIEDGDLRMQDFVSRLKTRFVDLEEIADLKGSENFFLNVNRPEDYQTAITVAAAQAAAAKARA